ncbi:MAG: polysaccharide biosynthesis C-terminal domain-containing protein [Bacteroides sp.]|jgi:O-antigen/teichoic acid export membrane protein|nr:polysaccharide biosynthesis C-terminal domain-containing protein [Bacteroides sp.]
MAVHPIKRLAGQTVIYGLSSIVGRLLNYLLVPLYTHLIFETQEYGVVTLMYSYVAFLLVILTYGMETAFFRFYENNPDNRLSVFSTTLFSILTTSSLFILLTNVFKQPIATSLGFGSHPEYIAWMGIIVGLDAIAAIPFARLRAENKPLKFALIKFVNIGVNIGLNLFLLLFCPWVMEQGPESIRPFISGFYDPGMGVGYVFISNLVATIVTLLLLIPVMLRSRLDFSGPLLRSMLLYSLPLMVAGLAGVINESLDKILLKYLLPEDIAMSQVGIYGACYKISIMMTIFIQAFRFAAEPFFFAQAAKKGAPELYAQVMKYFVIACLFIFLGIMLYIDIVQHFIGEAYREGLAVVPILLLANMFLGIYFNLSIWYKLTGQTRYGAWIAIIGAVITILLNIWWIPVWGYYGSAWATLACYFLMTLLSYLWGQKFFHVPYELKKLSLFILAALAVYFVSLLTASFPAAEKYAIAFALLGVFSLLILLIDRSLKDQVKRMITFK